MNSKKLLYLFGLITLLIFPLPTIFIRPWLDGTTSLHLFDLSKFNFSIITVGLLIGALFAFFSHYVMQSKLFKDVPLKVDELVKSLNLNYLEGIFFSICAGFGEEMLFRVGIQPYLGIWTTSILFIAIHGYISIKYPKNSMIGLLVLPLILTIAYGYEYYGLWFSVAIHFSYDAVLFMLIITENRKERKKITQ